MSRTKTRRTCCCLALIWLLAGVGLAQLQDKDSPGEPPKEKEPPDPKRPKIPEIPRDRLPPQTRPRPDPKTAQYLREPVYVRVQEAFWTEAGEECVPDSPVSQHYLEEYFRRAGHPVVETPKDAAYRIEGNAAVVYLETLTFKETVIGCKVEGSSAVRVLDRNGQEVEKFQVDPFPRTIASTEGERGREKMEKEASRDVLRMVAKLQYDNLFTRGKVFADTEVVSLIEALASPPPAAGAPITGEKVVNRLADMGFRAVPYLLEALSDTRTVLVDSAYPGLKNPDDLKVFHLADKALEEVFQKVSRLNLRSRDEHRFIIIQGWSNEWRRFCRPYRTSPAYLKAQARRDARKQTKDGASEKRAGSKSGSGEDG